MREQPPDLGLAKYCYLNRYVEQIVKDTLHHGRYSNKNKQMKTRLLFYLRNIYLQGIQAVFTIEEKENCTYANANTDLFTVTHACFLKLGKS